MKHRINLNTLGRDRKHGVSILRNLALSLLKHEKIRTTKTKAKYLKSFVEKMITKAKQDTLANRRKVYRDLRETPVLEKLFTDVAKRYKNRKGGYTRALALGPRKGDGAEVVLVELVEEILDDNVKEGEKPEEEKVIQPPPEKKESGEQAPAS